jgi:hypothetical protein
MKYVRSEVNRCQVRIESGCCREAVKPLRISKAYRDLVGFTHTES